MPLKQENMQVFETNRIKGGSQRKKISPSGYQAVGNQDTRKNRTKIIL